MAITVTDASSAIWDFLKNQAGGSGTRGVIMSENVLEAGFIKPQVLTDAETLRRTNATPTKILALTVQDAGDEPTPVGNLQARIIFRLYDREYGYRNLRDARDHLLEDLREFTATLTAAPSRKRGVLSLDYAGRSGHQWSQTLACHWEGVLYRATIIVEDTDY